MHTYFTLRIIILCKIVRNILILCVVTSEHYCCNKKKLNHYDKKCIETEFFDRQQSSHPVEVICATWNDYSVDFVHLKPVFHTAVVEEGQRRVLKEYLKALLTKLVTYSQL